MDKIPKIVQDGLCDILHKLDIELEQAVKDSNVEKTDIILNYIAIVQKANNKL